MKHLGDITKIHGDQIEPVNCITFGSPCQDLSIAGRRAGLAGERSGLFMEAVRIIKEMRSSTNGLYPTFAIWENVPGAFSSNGGEDFRAVLEELARIAQPDVSIPRPSGRGGRWSRAGAIAGNGWSLAWRQLDAQYWGVPQRRKRIALVVDFRGQRATEILFERTSVSGHPDESIKAWETTPGHSQASHFGCDRTSEKVIYDARGNGDGRTCQTITGDHENRITDYTAIAIERHKPATDLLKAACLSEETAEKYLKGRGGYGWHISNLKIYDRPRPLSDFTRMRATKFGYEPVDIERPPQSWFYVEELYT